MDIEQDIIENGIKKLAILIGGNVSTVSSDISTTEDPFFQDTFFHPSLIEDDAPCKAILHVHVGNSNIRVWDILLLIPNLAFLLFLFFRLSSTRMRLRATKSEVIRMFYSLVLALVLTGSFRCFIAIILYLTNPVHDRMDTLIWECGQMIFLTIEITVGLLAMTGGKRDSLSHCRRIIIVSCLISMVISSIQLYMEVSQPYYGYMVLETGYQMYGSGGPVFAAVMSFIMVLFYFIMLVVRMSSAKHGALISPGFRYYLYLVSLLSLHSLACVGAATLSVQINSGLCITNITKYFYFTLLAPLTYICFLQTNLSTAHTNFQFSYRSQQDDEDEYHEDDLYGNISISSSFSDGNI